MGERGDECNAMPAERTRTRTMTMTRIMDGDDEGGRRTFEESKGSVTSREHSLRLLGREIGPVRSAALMRKGGRVWTTRIATAHVWRRQGRRVAVDWNKELMSGREHGASDTWRVPPTIFLRLLRVSP